MRAHLSMLLATAATAAIAGTAAAQSTPAPQDTSGNASANASANASGNTSGNTSGSTAAQPAPSVEEVLVTAAKREQRIVDVPSAVTAVSGESLDARRLTRIEDFAAQVPGLSLQTNSSGGVTLVLRGLNTGGSGANVATLLDDVSLTYATANANGNADTPNIDTFDLRRVEVLRGPQGTLYGASAEGGLLKYVYNLPNLSRFESGAEAGFDSVDHGELGYSLHGLVNVPLSPNFAIRATGFDYRDAGFIDNPLLGRKDDNEGKRYGFRVSALWTPTSELTIRASALRQVTHYDGNLQVEVNGAPNPLSAGSSQFDIANGGRLERSSYVAEPSTRTFDLYDLHAEYAGDWFVLTSITGYGKNKSHYTTDFTDYPVAPGLSFGSYLSGALGQPVTVYALQDEALEKVSQELRISSVPGSRIGSLPVDLQAGFYYTHENVAYGQSGFDSLISNPAVALTAPPQGRYQLPGHYEEYSGFADANLHLTSRLQLEGGVRYTDDTISTQVIYYNGLRYPVPTPVYAFPVVKASDHPTTWSVSAKYDLTDRSSLYARIASGFRPGGSNVPFVGQPAFPNYRSDSTVNYEVGYKGNLFRELSADVGLFYIDWSDIQILTSVSTPAGFFYYTGNAGSAVSKGVEWNLAWTPLSGLTLSDVGAYTDASLTTDAPGLGALKGDQLPYVPKVTNTVNADYSWFPAEGLKATLRGSWSFVDDRNGGFTLSPLLVNKPDVPAYNTLSLSAEVRKGRYWAQAFIDNLTDERGITNYVSASGHNGTGLANIINPRTVGLRIGFTY